MPTLSPTRKVAVVTGAGSGIGKATALALVGDGFAPAMWLGLAYFVGLCVFFYRRVLRK